MNYMKQLNAFKDYLVFHDMPSGGILLWHTLMMINNMAGWKRRFNASGALIQQYGGLSKQRLSEARAALVNGGLIHYEPGARGRAPVYEMVILYDLRQQEAHKAPEHKENHITDSKECVQVPDLSRNRYTEEMADQLHDPSHDRHTDQLPDQSRTILKQKEKQKQKRRRGKQADPFMFYNQNFQALKPAASDIIANWSAKHGESLVLEAMQITVMHGGKTLKYIERILNEWSTAGLSSLNQVRDFEKQKRTKRKQHGWKPTWKKMQAANKSALDKLREEMLA